MSATGQQRLAKGITWAARIIGLGATAFLLLAWLLQMVWRAALWASDILYLVYLGIALAACIVSWWRQWLAGILLLLVSFALGSYLGLSSPWGIAVLVAWSPEFGLPFFVAGLLFLLSWWLTRQTGSSAPPPSSTL
jgi:hypothetical protein